MSQKSMVDALTGEPSAGIDLLVNVISEATLGRDISPVVASIIQAVFGRTNVNVTLKKLTYDMCKIVHLSDDDCDYLLRSMSYDLAKSTDPALLISVLRFLPTLPGPKLVRLHEIGELDSMAGPMLLAADGGVRAAAVEALHQVLLSPPILAAAASSPPVANAFQESWAALCDMLLDDEPLAVGAAIAAVADLMSCGLSADAAAPEGFLLQRIGSISGARVAAALGPVLERAGAVPRLQQLSACRMLASLVEQALCARPPLGSGAVALPVGGDTMVPSLGTTVPAAAAYLHARTRDADPALRLEACRCLLRVCASVRAAAAADPLPLGGGGGASCPLIPDVWAASAVASLLELQPRQLVEPGLADVVLSIAANLRGLPPAVLQHAVSSLLPLVSNVSDAPARLEAYTLVWDAVLEEELSGSCGRDGLSLDALLADPYIVSMMKGSAAATRVKGEWLEPAFKTMAQRMPPPPVVVPPPAAVVPEEETKVAKKGKKAAPASPAAASEGKLPAKAGATKRRPKTLTPCSPLVGGGARALGEGKEEDATKSAEKKKKAEDDAKTVATKAAADKAAVAKAPASTGLGGMLFGAMGYFEKDAKKEAAKAEAKENKDRAAAAAAAAAEQQRPRGEAKKDLVGKVFDTAAQAQDWSKSAAQRVAGAVGGISATPTSAATDSARGSHVNGVGGSVLMPSVPGANVVVATDVEDYPGGAAGAAGGAGAPGAGGALDGGGPGRAGRAERLATARHEVAVSLLGAVTAHAQADEAHELCMQAQGDALRDIAARASAADGADSVRTRCARVLDWLQASRAILAATQGCLWWEPAVTSAITATRSAEAEGHTPADFSCLPADCWLQLAQAAAHSARASRLLLKASVDAAADAALVAQAGGVDNSGDAAPARKKETKGGKPDALTQLLHDTTAECESLQVLLRQLLRGWGALSRSVRPRVVWVCAHYLDLSASMDSSWELLLKALTETMPRAATSSRLGELMASASLGALFRSERASWPRDKPFVFDVSAAAALIERPELELLSLFVSLVCLQHLASLLLNALSAASVDVVAWRRRQEAAGAVGGVAPDVAAVQADCVAVAARLEGLAREAQTPEVASSPHLKEWVSRVMRMCGAVACYSPPKASSPPADDNDDTNSDSDSSSVGGNGRGSNALRKPGAFPGMAADAPSSSSSSDAGGGLEINTIMMPPSMYRPGMGRGAPPPGPGGGGGGPQFGGAAAAFASGVEAPPIARMGSDDLTDTLKGTTGGAAPSGPPTTVSTVVLNPPPYLIMSATTDCLWGYPFAGPRTSILFNSKRARRHRVLRDQAAAARARVAARGGHAAAGSKQQHGNSMLLGGRGARLESPEFWGGMAGEPGRWRELSGPADPLLLVAALQPPQRHAGGGGGSAKDCVSVVLEVRSRLPVDVVGAKVHVRTVGPVNVERRAMVWDLPRLSPGDKATTRFSLQLLGFGAAEVACSIELYSSVPPGEAAPVQLFCDPLPIPMTMGLRAVGPTAPPLLTAPDFFRLWSSLPARTELSGTCAWPGADGQATTLSGLLRAPLTCVLLQHLPAQAALQAAFTATTLAGDDLLLLAFTQLLPPPHPADCADASCGALQLYVRSASPEAVHAVALAGRAFLADATGGTVLPAYGPPARATTGRPRPAVDARVAALMLADALGAPPLSRSQLASRAAGGDDNDAPSGAAARAPPPPPPGPKEVGAPKGGGSSKKKIAELGEEQVV
ncbi:hypothetical protein FOA52_002479 [Chlamydomonas sp. UWO 241]|nr:hypothetical protein FOA52_002479 [Chlamydomonas sp. UWO 241]